MADQTESPCIFVLAGANGAGKSSIAGSWLVRRGAEYFNPDEAARRSLSAHPGMTLTDANSQAWNHGKRLLERAIAERLDFAFETTLGGHTITNLLNSALSQGIEVRIWYVALSSVELHIARVHSRVAGGGHDIPEARIKERYHRSRLNLIQLMPTLTELRVYDNSEEADPRAGLVPQPKLILHFAGGKIMNCCELTDVPEWAKPIVVEAIKLSGLE